jgi:chromosome segregation ATPase
LTSLTAIFGSSQEKPAEESEKLLNLYWNRAELKKEFAELRKEQLRLQDRIKHQDGARARIEQKLDYIEHLLLDREWVHSVLVHYQFRALNLRCQSKLEKFAEQLKQQREQRQHSRQLSDWNARLQEEKEDIERQIREQRMHIQTLEDKLQAERRRLVTMNGFVKFFRRRSLTATLDGIAAEIEATQAEEAQLLQRCEEVKNRQPPDTQGLDIPTKRIINFMIIAFAQQLYLHFREDELVTMAKEAGEKSVGAINYGAKKDCDALIARLHKRADNFDSAASFADALQKRAKLISENASFASHDDAVPVAHSVATAFEISESGSVRKSDANLLGDDYWNLSNILSR